MDLTDRCDDLIKTYSGGMRRRLELAQALVHEPKVLFLDEPTLGLDVSARRRIWNHILSLRKHDITIFMTTHYMEEADEYCDRVAIIDKGRITALGTPQELKSNLEISNPTLNDVFMDKITTREDECAFDGYKFRTMLRRRS
jgi:ABC-2 type transport system ATP-binding protein